MKIHFTYLPGRIKVKESKFEGILNYDTDNAYPQRMMRYVDASGTAKRCINTYGKFINGRGFKYELFYKAKVGRKLTNDKLLRAITKDFARFNGFAVQINYNLNFQKTSFNFIPFENTRLTIPDETGFISKIAIYSDWGKEKTSYIKKADIQYLDVYNPDLNVITEQIKGAGGINKWKGQIFWYSGDGDFIYPLTIYDSVIEDIDTDAQIQVYRNSNVRTGFMAGHIFIHKGKFETPEKRTEFVKELSEFQGAETAGRIMLVEVENTEQIPEIKAVEQSINAKVIDITNRNTKDSIIEAFGQPPILSGAQIAGGTGITFSNDAMKLATDYYNTVTDPDRILMEEIFTELFSNYVDLNINPSNDFSILPMTWQPVQDEPVL